MGMRRSSRTLQFSTYSFDTSMSDTYGTFMQGAVLCICSDWERLNDLAKSIRLLKANYVCLTPTVAEQLDPEDVPSLKTLCVGGEALSATLVDRWADRLDLINVYGITECLVWNFTTEPLRRGRFLRSIGRPTCGRVWVTAAEDPAQLLGFGTIGELLIEGPNLAREYLNNPQKTAESFINPPRWLQKLHPSTQGKRLYRSGDLVRQLEDGSFEYFGRRDTQIKLNGQRIELGEIEHHMRNLLPAGTQLAAHVLDSRKKYHRMLVGSVCLNNGALKVKEADFETIAKNLRSSMTKLLPSLLVPATFVQIFEMPMTVSGKLDRQSLHEMVAEHVASNPLSLDNYNSLQATSQPLNEIEAQLALMWSSLLEIEYDTIKVDHQFVRLGGNSVQAMKLVTLARKKGLCLSVADILQHQRLSEMAQVARPAGIRVQEPIHPFSLLVSPEDVFQTAKKQFGVKGVSIQDAYPCTPLQQGLFALSMSQPGAYVARTIIELPSTITLAAYMKAWEQVYRQYEILRTKIIETNEGLVQVVIDEDLSWDHLESFSQYQKDNDHLSMGLGSNLNKFAFVNSNEGEPAKIIWIAHHCTYDGWSAPFVLREVSRVVGGLSLTPHTSFNRFIKHLGEQNAKVSENYWKEQLRELEAPNFPVRENLNHNEPKTLSVQKRIKLAPRGVFTTSTLIRAALALLISKYSNSDCIVFGTVTSGRNASLEGIDMIVGPTFSTVPIRVRVDSGQSVSDYLKDIQDQAVEMIPHEMFGLQNIRKLNAETEVACGFQCLLIIQPPDGEDGLDGIKVTDDEYSDAGTYPLTIDCKFESSEALFQVFYDSIVLEQIWVERFLLQIEHVLRQLSLSSTQDSLKDLELVGHADQNLISSWNATYPSAVDRRVCDVIMEKCRAIPRKQAVCSWDGNFSYEQLDMLSTTLACELLHRGVGPEIIVPIIFERSKWVVIALLAVNKAGGAFVLLNPTHPLNRLQSIVGQTDSQVILSSFECLKLSSKLLSNVIVVERFLDCSGRTDATRNILIASAKMDESRYNYKPSDLLYIVFTSGTSGLPKGIMIENRSFSTYIEALARMTNAKENWRGLVSSAFSFDSSLEEILMPLMLGGTICMPSQHDLSNDLTGAMNRMEVDWGVFTPSLARLIDPKQLTTVKDLYMGGKQLTDALVKTYGSCVRLTNTYGPSECCPTGCISSTPELYGGHIGRGVACRTWIVDPDDQERLMPVGCVGELILDGPNVGRGYLNDEKKTRESFISPPVWLKSIQEKTETRHASIYPCRLYKTGDLVRYCSNGTLEYIGRKDQQVKLYGQRIELSEVEHHIQLSASEPIEVVVDVASRNTDSDHQILVAFIVFQNEISSTKLSEGCSYNHNGNLNLRKSLAGKIPQYMIPSLYVRLSKLPLTSSDKIDRRKLKQLVLDLTDTEYTAALGAETEKRPPVTEYQLGLQELWSEILKMSRKHIGLDDKFLQIGGDSIRAIKLAAMARKRGWNLTVAEITKYDSLEDMSQQIKSLTVLPVLSSAFSLLVDKDKTRLITEAARSCGIDEAEVEDIYPCSHLQKGIMALSLKHPSSYVAKDLFEVSNHVEVDRISNACRKLMNDNSILRTRIVHIHGGFYQVVLRGNLEWNLQNSTKTDSSNSTLRDMGLGQCLCFFELIQNPTASSKKLAWRIHHALYDGWSLNLLKRQLIQTLQGHVSVDSVVPYNSFIWHTMEMSEHASSTFWKESFIGTSPTHFPKMPRPDYLACPNKFLEIHLDIQQETKFQGGMPGIICAAWAIVVSRYTECQHVSLGITTSGRKANLPGIEAITGPTFATVPVIVRLDSAPTKELLLQQLHRQSVGQTDYEQFGLENIGLSSPEAHEACGFQTLLVVQPVEFDDEDQHNVILRDISPEQADISTHPLTLECQLTTTGLIMKARFDEKVLSEFEMSHMLSQFCEAVRKLCLPQDCLVQDITTTSPEDLAQITSWNDKPLQSVNICIHDLILVKTILAPDSTAVCSWDGDITYAQLEEHSRIIGLKLQEEEEVKVGDTVPLLMDKSVWSVITMLAILRCGAAVVLLDKVNHPHARMKKICEEVRARIIVCGPAHYDIALSLVSRAMAVSTETLEASPDNINRPLQSSAISSDAAFVIFTSGSTGVPKGIVHEHRSLSSSYISIAPVLNLSSTSRVYQFSAFTFDMCIIETFATLISGGTVCIPSDDERLNNVEGSFSRLRCNWAFFTPSFSRQLNPSKMLGLQTLCLGGESISQTDVDLWLPNVDELMTVSGPAETSLCTAGRLGAHQLPYIGNMIGGRSWIVHISDHNQLAPLGVVGELLVEGPVVARGYLNLPETTSKAFIDLPDWLCDKPEKPLRRLYKTGDLVKYNHDGGMQIFGRKDGQVKIRGQRVELEEVEHQVKKALDFLRPGQTYEYAVDAFSPAHDKNTKLLAIFTRGDTSRELTCSIFERLHTKLPPYMVPTVLIPLSEIPVTATKKVDRQKLRSIASGMPRSDLIESMGLQKRIRIPASNNVEKAIHRLWSKILQVDIQTISSDDKFIPLGGDSLRAVAFVSAARDEGFHVTVADVFRRPVLRDLATTMNPSNKISLEAIPREAMEHSDQCFVDSDILIDICKTIPLVNKHNCIDLRPCTPTQKFMLTGYGMGREVFQPHMSFKITLTEGRIDLDRFIRAWKETVAKHSILRTVFVELSHTGNRWYQIVLDKIDADIDCISGSEAQFEPIDDLLQITRRQLPAWKLIIKDAEQMGFIYVLFGEIAQSYAKFPSPSHGPQYRDFQRYLQNSPTQNSFRFWSSYLENLKPCLVPTRRYDNGLTDFRSVSFQLQNLNGLRKLCHEHDITLSMLIQAAWARTLGECTGNCDVVFGSITSNRDVELPGIEKIIGPVFGIVVRRFRVLEKASSTSDFLRQCQDDWINCMPHRGLSFLEYFETLHNQSYKQELFNTVINYRRFARPKEDFLASESSRLVFNNISTIDPYAFDILLGIDDDDEHDDVPIYAQLDYWNSKIADEQANELVHTLISELHAMLL
ncbi:non-ribosomal peptide synthetase protein [Phlyctema vagabunda]|uniref:Non-ribosomal peptide synthetase protein n=1 Tax=Phlyctema vagabunda TaxID=108571 RepID=A0ABR4PAP4_9HELO